MAIVLDGSSGITNDGGYTGDGVVFADTTPANTLVTTTGGNVGVGTASPVAVANATTVTINGTSAGQLYLQSGGANRAAIYANSTEFSLYGTGDRPMRFFTNDAERARIESGGNFLVGTTSSVGAGFRLQVAGTAATNSYSGFLNNGGTSSNGLYVGLGGNRSSDTTYNFLQCSDDVAGRLLIRGNGNVVNTNNSYGGISDAKLKENITDATPKLEKLQHVRVVNYNLIGDEQKQIGVIAQELEQVFPGMVEESPDRDKEGNDLGTTTKSVKYSVFVPMLIKAIQEQQAIITALTARVSALEGTQNV